MANAATYWPGKRTNLSLLLRFDSFFPLQGWNVKFFFFLFFFSFLFLSFFYFALSLGVNPCSGLADWVETVCWVTKQAGEDSLKAGGSQDHHSFPHKGQPFCCWTATLSFRPFFMDQMTLCRMSWINCHSRWGTSFPRISFWQLALRIRSKISRPSQRHSVRRRSRRPSRIRRRTMQQRNRWSVHSLPFFFFLSSLMRDLNLFFFLPVRIWPEAPQRIQGRETESTLRSRSWLALLFKDICQSRGIVFKPGRRGGVFFRTFACTTSRPQRCIFPLKKWL